MLEATLLEGVPKNADAYAKEAFGPLACLSSFSDFDEALGHASPSFQASVDTQAFQAIIESGFSYLLADNAVSFGLCLVTNGTPSLEVRVGQPTVAKLIYFFTEDKKQWWIDGAAPAADKLAERIEVS